MYIWADEEDKIFDTDEVDDGKTKMQADVVANFFQGVLKMEGSKMKKLKRNLKIRG
jgi:hypothetical protein